MVITASEEGWTKTEEGKRQEKSIIIASQIYYRGGTILNKDFHAKRVLTGKSVHVIYSEKVLITVKLFNSFLSLSFTSCTLTWKSL